MATTISSGTNPYKLGSPPDFGTLYSGRALEFDGVTDYLDTGYVLSSSAHTICIWAKIVPNTGNKFIFDTRDGNNDGILLYADGEGKIGYLINNTDILTSIVGQFDNTWVRIVATSDGSTQYLYINGALHTSQSISETISTTTSVRIGAQSSSVASYFNGMLSNVQAWDKVWTLSDVQYDYTHPEKLITDNSAVTSGTTISNLKLWYPMTEGNPRSPQTTVYDGSPNNSPPVLPPCLRRRSMVS